MIHTLPVTNPTWSVKFGVQQIKCQLRILT